MHKEFKTILIFFFWLLYTNVYTNNPVLYSFDLKRITIKTKYLCLNKQQYIREYIGWKVN